MRCLARCGDVKCSEAGDDDGDYDEVNDGWRWCVLHHVCTNSDLMHYCLHESTDDDDARAH